MHWTRISRVARRFTLVVCIFVMCAMLCVAALGETSGEQKSVSLSSHGPWLMFDYSLGLGMGSVGYKVGGAKFEVQISDGGPFKTLYRSIYSTMRWYPYAVNLSEYAGKKIKVRFSTEHVDGRIMMDYPHWGNPRLVVGDLFGKTPPKEIFNFAMTPIERVGGVLPDGKEFTFSEIDPIFNDKLVTKGLLDREHKLLVYAGNNYICVPGKAEPGIYMGVSMSVDYLLIGCDPQQTPYTGKMPPPVFAEWTVDVPSVRTNDASQMALVSKPVKTSGPFVLLSTNEDKYAYKPGLIAKCDKKSLQLEACMGDKADLGWAFAGIEAMNLPSVKLDVSKFGVFETKDPNSFAGLIIDYHTLNGYQKRIFLGLGAGSSERYDIRPGSWIYDSASMSLKQRLEFKSEFIDISNQLKSNHSTINLNITKYAPLDWDGRVWLATGVQNQPLNSGLKVALLGLKSYTPNVEVKAIPAKQGRYMLIDNGQMVFAISKVNGAICGGWLKETGGRVMTESSDTYSIERFTSITDSSELYDKVIASKRVMVDGRPELIVNCSNVILPDLKIAKRYSINTDGSLTKRVAFKTSDNEGFFIKYTCSTGIDENWRKSARGYGAMTSHKVVAQGKVVELTEDVAPEQGGNSLAPILIMNDYSFGIAGFRDSVNDQFVLRSTSKGLRNGWTSKVFTDYLKSGQEVSGQYRWVFFKGDSTAFSRYYQKLPGYTAIADVLHPQWTKRILSDAMYLVNGQDKFTSAAAPLLVTDTIWFLNSPWGNWGSYHADPNDKFPNVYSIAPAAKSTQPNVRVAKYNNFAFDTGSDVYKYHPEYGVRDRSGELLSSGINSDATKSATFYFQILNPKVRRAMIDMYCSQVRDWGLDFFYTDGPGANDEEIDWGYKDVTQSYDWINFYKEVKTALQNINPDCAYFVNGWMPCSDIGYIENRDEQWNSALSSDWRQVATDLFESKLNEPEGFITVPTYGLPTADPGLSTYDVMYGWIGHLFYVERMPWMHAGWEYQGMRLVEDAVEPRWYRSDVSFEANAFRKGNTAILNMINHDTKPQNITVTLDMSKLGFKKGTPIYAWVMRMNDTPVVDGSGKITARSDKAMTPSILFWGKPCEEKMKITLPTDPIRLYSIVFSPVPAVLESVDGKAVETGITEHVDVDIKSKPIENGVMLTLNCRADKASILLPGYESAAGVSTSWPVSVVDWCGRKALRVTVGRGEHHLKVTHAAPDPSTVVFSCDFTGAGTTLWYDTNKPDGTVIDIRKTEGYDFNTALRVEGNDSEAYTRQVCYVSPSGRSQRYLVCEFDARVLKADGNNTPADVTFEIGGGSGLIDAAAQFHSESAPEYPMQIVCNGHSAGAFKVSPAAMEPNGNVEWYHIKLVFDKEDGKATFFRGPSRVAEWTMPGSVGNWESVKIGVNVRQGSGNGKAEYDNFRVTTRETL